MKLMENKEEKVIKEKKKTKIHDKSQIFVKIMAGILAILMIVATASSLIYALI
jgi:hypothetical protein